jgi:hypothetical protein
LAAFEKSEVAFVLASHTNLLKPTRNGSILGIAKAKQPATMFFPSDLE